MSELPDKVEKHLFSEMTLWLIKNRPGEDIRPQLDINWRIEKQNLIIYEVRPNFRDPKNIMHIDIARAAYIKSRNHWKIYWKRADLKWHGYEALPQVTEIKHFLKEVDKDPYGCFWG